MFVLCPYWVFWLLTQVPYCRCRASLSSLTRGLKAGAAREAHLRAQAVQEELSAPADVIGDSPGSVLDSSASVSDSSGSFIAEETDHPLDVARRIFTPGGLAQATEDAARGQDPLSKYGG